jgi:hypothetical protein
MRREFHEHIATAGRETGQGPRSRRIGVDFHPGRFPLGDQRSATGLTGVALCTPIVSPPRSAVERTPGLSFGVHDQRLSRDDMGIAEISQPSPLWRDGGALVA